MLEDNSAFSGCTNLKSVIIKSSNCSIEKYSLPTSVKIYAPAGSTTETTAKAAGHTCLDISEAPHIKYVDKYLNYGDVTGEGHVNSSDASLILSEYSARSTSTPSAIPSKYQAAADVKLDGKVDASDASDVLSYYAYLSTGGDSSASLLQFFKRI